MIQIDEQKLRQLFKNRSNCYADSEDVVQAMDEDCFIETVNEALSLFAVSGRSEQLEPYEPDNYPKCKLCRIIHDPQICCQD